MHNSQKPKPLHRKQFNTENSQTPTKKPSQNTQSLNVSNHKTQNISVQNSYSMISSTVSYSKLQIILQNVQQVKKKATQQISSMEKKCMKLQEELKVAKEHIMRYQNLQETIKMEKLAVERKYEEELNKIRQQLQRKQEACNLLSEKISELTLSMNSSDQQTIKLKKQLKQKTNLYYELQRRYQALTTTLNITQLSPQLHLLRQHYKDLPSLLSSASQMSSTLDQQAFTLDQLKQANEQMKQQLNQNSQIMTNITEQNKQLLSVVTGLNKQKDKLNYILKQKEEEKIVQLKEKDCTLMEIQEQIVRVRKDSEQKVWEKEETIGEMKKKIILLESQLCELEEKEKTRKQESRFKAIVDEVCDQYADYENVLKRIQYLERYRSEYYFNVEKIQYLCKLLDS